MLGSRDRVLCLMPSAECIKPRHRWARSRRKNIPLSNFRYQNGLCATIRYDFGTKKTKKKHEMNVFFLGFLRPFQWTYASELNRVPQLGNDDFKHAVCVRARKPAYTCAKRELMRRTDQIGVWPSC